MIVRDPSIHQEVFNADGLNRGQSVYTDHAFQVVSVERSRVVLEPIDLGRLKDDWIGARSSTTRPAPGSGNNR
jgi:hypothetical protein